MFPLNLGYIENGKDIKVTVNILLYRIEDAGLKPLSPPLITYFNTIQYNADFYSAVSRKRIGGAWRQCLDRLCGSVCRGKELRL